MAIETIASNAALKKLATAWAEAKKSEDKANATRLGIEEKIWLAIENEIPETPTGDKKGSVRIENLKITCDLNSKWDQEKLQDIRATWPDAFPPFPFEEELKADGKSITFLRENIPSAYALIKPALMQNPKKPSFTLD